MYKSLEVKTSDGYQIATWFFSAKEAIFYEEFTQLAWLWSKFKI
ncbi:MAG: hypothetical protein PHR20_06980 [Bacteroidales bacterium]|nr:hypothetical protein [Bacteroidales bacterium]